MTAVNQDFDPGFVGLMDIAWRTVRRTLDARVRPRIEGQLAGHGPHLRASHMRLLSLTPADGIRLTDLATRATMTKQALGEFVATLQQVGLVEVTVDERDRRARLARPTQAGQDVQKAIQESFAEIERRLRAEVGPQRWDTFREVLAEVGAIADV